MWDKWSIYDNPISFSEEERESLDRLGVWEKETTRPVELWQKILDYEIHVVKFAPKADLPFWKITVGKWTGDANWSADRNHVFSKHYLDWDSFREELKESIDAFNSLYHYDNTKEDDFPYLDIYNRASKIIE